MMLEKRNDLENMLDQVRTTLENAEYLAQELVDEYFERFCPDEGDGKLSIIWEFKRKRSFARLLLDCLKQIESGLPSSEWIQTLQTEGDLKQ